MLSCQEQIRPKPHESTGTNSVNWRTALLHTVEQNPLIQTRVSLQALSQQTLSIQPRTIFLGLGLASRSALSTATPLDLLGLLLPAEQLRQSSQATHLAVLIADSHVMAYGFCPQAVRRRAQALRRVLNAIRAAFAWPHLRIYLASEIHRRVEYRDVLRQVERRARHDHFPYLRLQAADVEYFGRKFGRTLKVGWTLGARAIYPNTALDEWAFDRRTNEVIDSDTLFVYCKPGRSLDRLRPRVCPYLAPDPATRICLDQSKGVRDQLSWPPDTMMAPAVQGVIRHTKAILRQYSQMIRPLDGAFHSRLDQLIDNVSCRTMHEREALRSVRSGRQAAH